MIPLLLLLLFVVPRLVSTQTDAQCLTEFRESVNDGQQYLRSWSNASCSSVGVQCLHMSELKVYVLSLPSAGLGGDFPKGLDKCSSLTTLDLSGNSFTGPIPDTVCSMLPYLVKLDLSGNKITGRIPDLGGCQYLNMLHLQDNLLAGSLPAQIGLLQRLQDLNVAGNKLAGPVPSTFGRFPKAAFQNNAGLCGPPVSHSCSGSKASIGLIVGTVVGGALVIAAITGIVARIIMRRRHPQKMKDDATWATKIKAPRSIMVTMFEKPAVGIKFSDLLAATDRFSKDNLITEDSTGVSYKATLRDGSILAVKRLRASNKSEQQFRSEIEALGKVWHVNLVPLLGYCIAGSERLLIYKHMVNGSLWNWLYESSSPERLDWYARLRIALGTARGIGFLHHTCSPKIVHRNISPHTVLLDDDLEPRITGYGLSRLVSSSGFVNQDVLNENSDSGHTPPEYARVPVATTKGDVYSYGVVLLELLTSQKPVDLTFGEFKGNLVDWLSMYQASGRISGVLDKSLSTGKDVDDELNEVLQLACDCVRVAPTERPSMYEVFGQLKQLALKHNLTFPEDDIPVVVEHPPQQFKFKEFRAPLLVCFAMVWAVARAAIFLVSSPSSSSSSSSPGYRFRRIKFVRDCGRWGCNCSESHSKPEMPTKKSSATTTTTSSGNSELSRYGLDQWDFDLSTSSSGTSEKIDAEEEAQASKQWIAYLISSADSARTYVGITTNMKRRLKQHNGELAGGAKSGRAGRPWSLLCTVGSFSSRSEASQFEYQWKVRTKSVHGIKRTGDDDQAKDRLVQRRRVALERAIDADPKWNALTVEWHWV